MIIHSDGSPGGRRYSVGFVGSLFVHVVLAATLLWLADTLPPTERADVGVDSGRSTPRHSSALLGGGDERSCLDPGNDL